MLASRATFPGRAKLSIPECGKRRCRAVEWRGGSTSTAMVKAICRGTAASIARSLSIRSIPYRYWQAQLSRTDFAYGQFGENFTVDGLPDAEVCIGDHYRIGSALFEVTQPRVTCYRLGIRMNEPQMPALVVAHHRPGFYFRVLEEGEVEAGDEIVKVSAGPEHLTVAEIDALLYLPGRDKGGLERALRIPALSAGWRSSFETLLEHERQGGSTAGNPALAPATGPPPAWVGFRPLRVADKRRESSNVTSLMLEPSDGHPLVAAMPGQFVVLRLKPAPEAPALLRSYSLSERTERRALAPQHQARAERRRRGLRRHRAQGRRRHRRQRAARRFHARAGRRPCRPAERRHRLNSGARHAACAGRKRLAERRLVDSRRPQRRRARVRRGSAGASQIVARQAIATSVTARPARQTGWRSISMAAGRVDVQVLKELGAPREADFYLCGPAAFMSGLTADLMNWGVPAARLHSENFGAGPALTPGVVAAPLRAPHPPERPAGTGPMVSFARSNLAVRWDKAFQSLLELAEACDVPVRWACRTGVCHNCESGLIAGAVDYLPEPLEPPGEGNLLICCSRPRADVVLDL